MITISQTNRLPEPLLQEDNSRFTQFPIKYPKLQDMYKLHSSMFWLETEIDYSADYDDWLKLSDNERFFIEHILAFFAGADGIVLENLMSRFSTEVKASEVRNFYGFQAMIENVHGLTYSMLIEAYVKEPKRKQELFEAIDRIPCVTKKQNWALKWMESDRPFEERIFAFAVVEGLFFSGSFCSIFWLKSRHKMTKALGKSNELISRDENLHFLFAVLLHEHLNNKIREEVAYSIVKEAVEIETEFICQSLPCRLIGMNSELMSQYIRYVADRLLVQFGFEKIYKTENPFDFMTNISLEGKTNFFEERVTEYSRNSSSVAKEDCWTFSEDF